MSDLSVFNFENASVRVIVENNDPWFNAKDVCEALELANPRDALTKHVDAEDVAKRDTLTAGGVQKQNYVNESGLYALILGSTKEAAKRFKRWVTSEVLPSIRKTGGYSATPAMRPDPNPMLPSTQAKCLMKDMLDAAEMFGVPLHIAQVESVKAAHLKFNVDFSPLLLAAPAQSNIKKEEMMLEPTPLALELGYGSPQKMNAALAEAGLQLRAVVGWEPTEKGQRLCVRQQWKSGTKTGYNLKWKVEAVREILAQAAQQAA